MILIFMELAMRDERWAKVLNCPLREVVESLLYDMYVRHVATLMLVHYPSETTGWEPLVRPPLFGI